MHSIKKYTSLGVFVIMNMALQFLFQWYIIVHFGAGAKTDAFFGAMALPQFILLVLSGSLTMVLIPIISKYNDNEFSKESWNYFQVIGLLFTALSLILVVTAPLWVVLILPGFKGNDFVLIVNMTRIQSGSMVFSALLSVLWAVHSAKRNFVLIETTSIIANCLALVALLIFGKNIGIYTATWISVFRTFFQVLFLMKILGPYESPQFSSPSFKIIWKKLKPLLAGNLYYKTDMLVDRYLTSTGMPGQLTLFNLAQQLYMIATSILSKVLINTIIPSLSIMHHEANAFFYKKYMQRFKLVLIISVIVYIFVLLIGKQVLSFVFSVKNFSSTDVNNLWILMVCLFGLWFAGLLGSLTTGTFYAKGNTTTPTIISVILFTLYVPIKIFIYWKYGIIGLALSVSIYMIGNLVLQMFFLHKQKV